MQYQSTRNKALSVSSAEAIKKGLSEEGGLFVPEALPGMTLDEIGALADLNYRERAYRVLKKFLTDFTDEELNYCIDNAYTKEKFETDNIAPVYKLNDSTYFLELWHGPTCAFKDMALQILPYLLTTSMEKTNESDEVVILVATSGDTGKAALEGFKDVKGTRIIDDAQSGVKKIFTDDEFNKILKNNGFKLSSANSINWGRLVPQIVYYFSAYADLLAGGEIKIGDKINIVVPTGNFGNILAAYYAYKMGLPVNKFICASNINNVLTDFLKDGVYDKNRQFHTTISPSMDILISSNLERFLYDLSDRDDKLIASWMTELNTTGKYEVSADIKAKIKDLFWAGCSDDQKTMETISKCMQDYDYTIDTHTAVGKAVYDNYVEETGDGTKTVIASTASPFKFNQSVLAALGGNQAIVGKDEFELLDELSKISGMTIPKSLGELKTKTRLFNLVCEKEEMPNVVNEFLNM